MTACKKIRLDEVTIMRTILALLIVFMHSFTCYNGGWKQPEGYIDVPLYRWLSRLSFAFTLEAFVFISGYLFAFQQIVLKRGRDMSIIIGKLRRLILPSIVFSILYVLIFPQGDSFFITIFKIIKGCGHMWFLPMLFWCFVFTWGIQYVKVSDSQKILFFLILNLCSSSFLPMRIGEASSFLVYFYGGYLFFKNADRIKPNISFNKIIVSWVSFVCAFIIFCPIRDNLAQLAQTSNFLVHSFYLACEHTCHFLYASIGLIAFYFTAVYYVEKNKLTATTIKIASYCFAIYIFQQFILQFLYYKTSFPLHVGPYVLPWLGFLITLCISYTISSLFLKLRIGRFLIG